ncbi:hypothetical protein VTI74DRAFT_9034 [Chaetomium olivicolor]
MDWAERLRSSRMLSILSAGPKPPSREMAVSIVNVNDKALPIRNEDGNTPLHLAAECGDLELVKRILPRWSYVIWPDHTTNSVSKERPVKLLEWAAREGILDVVMSLRDRADPPSLERSLVLASGGGHLDVVRYLLEEGVDPNASPDGETPLLGAISCHAVAGVLELLSDELLESGRVRLDTGTYYDKFGRPESNPLLEACRRGHHDIVKLLVRRSFVDRGWINLDIKDFRGSTPLSLACGQGHWRVVDILLNASSWRRGLIDLNSKLDAYDTMPFHLACRTTQETVESFLKSGVIKQKIVDPGSLLRLDVVKLFSRRSLLRQYMIPETLSRESPVFCACTVGHWQIVECILDYCSQDESTLDRGFGAVGSQGRTPFKQISGQEPD